MRYLVVRVYSHEVEVMAKSNTEKHTADFIYTVYADIALFSLGASQS